MARHEQEIQAQMTTMHWHIESLLQVVNESTAKIKHSQPHYTLDIKLVPLPAKDYIEAYLPCDFWKNTGCSQNSLGAVALSALTEKAQLPNAKCLPKKEFLMFL